MRANEVYFGIHIEMRGHQRVAQVVDFDLFNSPFFSRTKYFPVYYLMWPQARNAAQCAVLCMAFHRPAANLTYLHFYPLISMQSFAF